MARKNRVRQGSVDFTEFAQDQEIINRRIAAVLKKLELCIGDDK